MAESTKIVTRFAPSPTGMFHVGGIRSALYNYLYARQNKGIFILRCEDTDPVRSKKEYEDYFLQVFDWLGLEYDAYYKQSDRNALYKDYIRKLIDEGKAYLSKEEVKKEGDRDEVIRFKNPNTVITFSDEVLGDVSFDTTELGDFVIARDMENPLYHLTVVVDDFEMGVTHVIRGQEHVSNTPRQILIQEAIGAPRPVYVHASTILNTKRAKLSKRDPTVMPSLEYREKGYLPEALLNFMVLLGWNPGTEKEIFTLDELVEEFSFERMQKQGAVFNPEKLEWINKEHIKNLSFNDQLDQIEKYIPVEITTMSGYNRDSLAKAAPVILDKITNFGQVQKMASEGELSYLFGSTDYEAEGLLWKGKISKDDALKHLAYLTDLISGDTSIWDCQESVKKVIWEYADQEGRGAVLWPMRYALSGKDKSPDPFTLGYILGKDEVKNRLNKAIKKLS